MLIRPGRRRRPHPPSWAAHAFFFSSHSSLEPLGVSATRGGFSSEVSCALGTSLPNFSSLRSSAPSQVDCALDAGLHPRGARAPAEPEPQRFSGWTRASQVQVGCQARAWARGGAAARVLAGLRGDRGSGAPPRLGRAARVGEGARRAASLPARRRRRPRQTMNLRARRAKAGLGPAPLGSGLPKAIEPPQRRRFQSRRQSWARSVRPCASLRPAGKGGPGVARGSHAPLWLRGMRLELGVPGTRRRGGGAADRRRPAGGAPGAGHARSGCRGGNGSVQRSEDGSRGRGGFRHARPR